MDFSAAGTEDKSSGARLGETGAPDGIVIAETAVVSPQGSSVQLPVADEIR
jgi:hypothetical protein